jgi:hypothetical protein
MITCESFSSFTGGTDENKVGQILSGKENGNNNLIQKCAFFY